MIFAFDRPEIPVDTHVHRVGGRLGLFPPRHLARGRPRRDARDHRSRGRLRAAPEPDRPRPRASAGRGPAAASASCARMCVGSRDWARSSRSSETRFRGESAGSIRALRAPDARTSGSDEQARLLLLRPPRRPVAVIVPALGVLQGRLRRTTTARGPTRRVPTSSSSTNCGSCHTLAAAGTDGDRRPQPRRAPWRGRAATPEADRRAARSLSAIEHGLGEGPMPAGILQGAQAEQVANYVGRIAGQ